MSKRALTIGFFFVAAGVAGAVEQVDNAKLTDMYNRHYPSKRLTEAVSLRLQPTITVVAG